MFKIDNNAAESLLGTELLKCNAPISGILVAAAIITEKGIYFGHNIEKENPVIFEHAEIMAFSEVLSHEKEPIIIKIFMAGGGKVDKFKFYTPCFSCSHKLAPYMAKDATVTLLPLSNTQDKLTITFAELIASYSQVPYSMIQSSTFDKVQAELISKTVLVDKDIDFVTDLTLLGLKEKVQFYLTGSSTGRGGVSTLLNAKTHQKYRDIDIIGVIENDFDKIEIEIEKIIIKHYAVFSKLEKPVPDHQNKQGVVFKKTNYYCGEKKEQMIDFSFSSSFKGTLAYHAYEIKNWFHQLS
jgi:cytidine deaminase